MGIWGKLAKVASVGIGAALAPLTGGASLAIGSTLAGIIPDNKKKTTTSGSGNIDAFSKPLLEQGTKMFGASESAFEQALGTYGKLASGDKNELTAFTGTGTNELNRMYQTQINKASTTMNRGGAQSKVLAEAPGALERDALGLRLATRTGALEKLGGLSLAGAQVGNQAVGQAGNLSLGQGRLDLEKRGQDIGIANDIGQGVGSVLDKTGIWDKLGGAFGKIFGGGKDSSNFGINPF